MIFMPISNLFSFRIFHLLRDPRGKINSHLHLPSALYNFNSGINDFINACCSRMMQDISVRKKLETLYPNIFMEIHYETIAEKLTPSVELMYRFIYKRSPPTEVYALVNALENHGRGERLVRAIRRDDSSQTAQSWTSKLNINDLKIIERSSCRSIISYLNKTFITE